MSNKLLDEFLPPEETADELGVTRRTLDRWHARRIGPPRIQIGRKILYRRDAVVAWLLSNESQGRAA